MRRTQKDGYLPTLDGWRAIAILAVLFDHLAEYSPSRNYSRLGVFTHTGPNGVSLFFAISGFLICSRLLDEQRAFGSISLRGFYIRRGCRILPPALLYLIVIGVLSLAGLIVVSSAEWWSSFLFFRNYLPPHWIDRGWGGYTIHYWSLAVEEHFYLLWPAALVLFGKRNARWFGLTLALAVAVWRTLDFQHQWFSHWFPGLLFGSRTDIRLDALLLGCLIALVFDNGRAKTAFSERFRPWMWWLLVAAYFGIQVIYFCEHSRSYSILEAALLALIVMGTAFGNNTRIFALLEWPPMKWIGRLSYSLYLWQQLFLLPQATSGMAILQRFPINLFMIFLCAWLSYHFVERPFIRLGHRLAPPPTQGREDIARRAAIECSPVTSEVAQEAAG
jgi:peptidoglycan/LPS O-acetylase OafA/YrhL